jgi:hypothetical protein
VRKTDNLPPSSADVTESGSLNIPEPSGSHKPVVGMLLLLLLPLLQYLSQEVTAQKILKGVPNCGVQIVVLINSELITLISTSILSNLERTAYSVYQRGLFITLFVEVYETRIKAHGTKNSKEEG